MNSHSPPGELGIVLARIEPTAIEETARAAEAAGASIIWATDHVLWHEPTIDVFGALTLIARATSDVRIGSLVLQLPLRTTASVARSFSFLNALAPGRIIAGLGVGEHRGEYDAAGLLDRFHRRGRMLDSGIADLRRLLDAGTGDEDTAGSDRYQILPGARIPIWIGGRSEAAMDRAVRSGDAWVPHLCTAETYARDLQRLDDKLLSSGRDPGSVERAVAVAVSVDGVEPDVDPLRWIGDLYRLDGHLFERVLVRGDAAEVRDRIDAFRSAGAGHVALLVAGDRPADQLRAIATITP